MDEPSGADPARRHGAVTLRLHAETFRELVSVFRDAAQALTSAVPSHRHRRR
jgi:hypothetical protein